MPTQDIEIEKKALAKEYKELLRISYQSLSKEDKKLIRKAFDYAVDAHQHQRRKSGEAYIFHPIAVAKIVASEIGLDNGLARRLGGLGYEWETTRPRARRRSFARCARVDPCLRSQFALLVRERQRRPRQHIVNVERAELVEAVRERRYVHVLHLVHEQRRRLRRTKGVADDEDLLREHDSDGGVAILRKDAALEHRERRRRG